MKCSEWWDTTIRSSNSSRKLHIVWSWKKNKFKNHLLLAGSLMVTLFAWIAHKLQSSNKCTRKSSLAWTQKLRKHYRGVYLLKGKDSFRFPSVANRGHMIADVMDLETHLAEGESRMVTPNAQRVTCVTANQLSSVYDVFPLMLSFPDDDGDLSLLTKQCRRRTHVVPSSEASSSQVPKEAILEPTQRNLWVSGANFV